MDIITGFSVWSVDTTFPGYLLHSALGAYKVSQTLDVSQATRREGNTEALTLVRALAAYIDPLLYRGTTYGLMAGNAVWRALFDRVLAVVAEHAPGSGSDNFAVYGALPFAAVAMAEIAATWPAQRNTLLSGEALRPFNRLPRKQCPDRDSHAAHECDACWCPGRGD
jgi:hypothetical protein